jgi:carboxymethylenebutenolidase
MSGQYITTVSAHFPHRMAAAASLYGVGIITDKEDSPHLLLDKIKGELYYAFAETDQSVPAHILGELKQALDKADAKHELKVFPGTHRGFCFPERAVYDTLAADFRDVGPLLEARSSASARPASRSFFVVRPRKRQ